MADIKPKRLQMSRKPTEKGKHWTDRDKLKVIAAYAVTNNASRCEELTGVPANTINYWKTLPWWFEEMEKLRKADDANMVSGYTKIIKQTIAKLEERIEQGDVVVLKDGSSVLKPVAAKDLSTIAANATDKRHKILHEQRENSVNSVTMADRLKQIEDQFIKFMTAKTINGTVISKVIEIEAPVNAEQPELQTELQTGSENRV